MLGVLLGDGCVSEYLAKGRDRFVTASTASASEYWYYEEYIQPTFEKSFGVSGYLYHRKDNTTRYFVYGSRVATELVLIGIPIGKKHDASIPQCVLESGKTIPFIRASITLRAPSIGCTQNSTENMPGYMTIYLRYKYE